MLPDNTLLNPPPAAALLAELAVFRDSVARVLAEPHAWTRRPSTEEWALNEIACHLRDVEREVHQERLRALLADDGAFLPGVDADEWAEQRNYRAQDGRAALNDFLVARDETIALLSPLPAETWERRGQHTYFGPTSLREIVYLAVQHDRIHARQVAELSAGEP